MGRLSREIRRAIKVYLVLSGVALNILVSYAFLSGWYCKPTPAIRAELSIKLPPLRFDNQKGGEEK